MPWKFHKQTRWGDPDAWMLRELAKSMYNYEGPDEPPREKLKHWKELLRNALRSLNDVEELKDLHVSEGELPYKVYRFVDGESEVVRRGRGRGSTSCQARDTERHKLIPTVAVNFSNSQESYSISADLSNLHQHAAYQKASPLTNPTKDVIFQNKSSQMVNVGSATHAALSERDLQLSPFSQQSLFVNNEAEIFPGDLADNIADSTLNKLMSEFKHDNFRSRSPLLQDTEEINDMDIHEISLTDVEMLNNGTLPEPANCLTELSSYDRSQQCLRGNEFAEASPQNMEGIYGRTNGPNTGYHTAPMDIFYRSQNKNSSAICKPNPLSCIQNSPEQKQVNTSGDPVLPGINSHCVASPLVGDKSLLSCIIPQQSYPSVGSLLGNAPAASMLVVVKYNICQVVKWQVISGKFRICFVPDEETKESILTCPNPKQFGPTDAKLFELPDVGKDTGLSLESRDTKKILQNLTRGIIVDLRERNIYATRYCKAVPHFCNPGKTEFTKIERHQEVKIFDFQDYFGQSFNLHDRYHNANPHVRLSFAVMDANKRASALSVDIWHAEAYQGKLQLAENAHSLEAECSFSDEFDRRMQIEQQLKQPMAVQCYM